MESDGTRDAVGCGERVRDGGMGRWGEGEMGRWGDGNYKTICSGSRAAPLLFPMPNAQSPMPNC